MTSENQIFARQKLAKDDRSKERAYWLRMVVANLIDGDGGSKPSKDSEDQWAPVQVNVWEEGRFNPISNNTHIAVEGLTINKPDFTWTGIPDEKGRGDLIAEVRKEYYLWLWDLLSLEEAYRMKTFDMLTCGEGSIGCFVRGDGCEVEWCDFLSLDWDPAYEEPDKRRYVFYDQALTLGEAKAYYPNIERYQQITDETFDKVIRVRKYWDKDSQTECCIYKRDIIHGPAHNRYGARLPIRATRLSSAPSVKGAIGLVERQMGSQALALRLQNHFRETALSATPQRWVAGAVTNEDALRDVEEGDTTKILRLAAGAQMGITNGAEIQQTALEVYQMVMQNLNVESGVNEFKQGRTDTNVEFASQLGFMAQQSAPRERYLNQRIEEGMRDDLLSVIMPICAEFEGRSIRLEIAGQSIEFGGLAPINPILGSDGNVVMKPGGMAFKSSAQSLQETMIFANVLSLAVNLPPGLQERFVKMACDAAQVEGAEDWLSDMRAAQEQIAMQQQMAQEQAVPPAQSSASA